MDLSQLIRTKTDTSASTRRSLNIVFASSEVAPFSKTGGLGDVAASLPKALAMRGHKVAIFTPLYKHLNPHEMRLARRLQPLEVPRRSKNQSKVECQIWEGSVASGVRIFFVENEEYFGRDGLYGYDEKDFEDNPERFAFLSRAVVEFALQFSLPVDVLHCNDWHTALAPVYVNHYYADELKDVVTVQTIHNLAYQGAFPKKAIKATGLPKKFESTSELLDDNGNINFLQGGILHADAVTTVSPTYAKEIKSPEGGFGLHEILQECGDDLTGILNGADYSVWGPEVDRFIAVRYDLKDLNGKRRNKAELQHRFGLPIRPTLPLLGFIGRLTEQKGLDILVPAIDSLLKGIDDEQAGFQIVFVGDNHNEYSKALEKLAKTYPKRVAFVSGYSEELAHKIQAGCDMLLIPSRFEPCGLTQIYAMKYGTLPIVHATGGLADTVHDAGIEEGESTGFVFHDFNQDALAKTITRASLMYRNYRKWRPLMVNAMSRDFSWAKSAQKYEEIYYNLLEIPARPREEASSE